MLPPAVQKCIGIAEHPQLQVSETMSRLSYIFILKALSRAFFLALNLKKSLNLPLIENNLKGLLHVHL